ncbi:PH domain-containing protein [Cohnella lupini]|uniref:PH (Pleckstrin Homology) domain-containing protein n=1 Tax=Cohnella lupini TaxID=1294267 RepID=A0A3D9IWR4_9BACL|nr:PH domain-containing protein [Cohnella lupini]RED66260.1 PH (Pleckstrin Homology) domain-containing protein [Cohnella lupini]
MVNENVLWEGKPFNYGFPSFTRYQITERRVIIEKGIFTKKREEIQLYRVRDITLKRNLLERILKFGDITIFSTDTTSPSYILRNIRKSVDVSDLLGQASESARLKYRAHELTEVQVQ